MSGQTIRVLTVDDHPLLRAGVAALVETQPDMTIAGEASSGREAIEAFRNVKPDITLMDVQMPNLNGFETASLIYEREKQKGNGNRATLAVARKMVAYLLAVDREQRDFIPAEERRTAAA